MLCFAADLEFTLNFDFNLKIDFPDTLLDSSSSTYEAYQDAVRDAVSEQIMQAEARFV
jgi:hypothetical protein